MLTTLACLSCSLRPTEPAQRPGGCNFEASGNRDAVDLTPSPDGHPEKSLYLYNFGHSFLTRFKCLGQLSGSPL